MKPPNVEHTILKLTTERVGILMLRIDQDEAGPAKGSREGSAALSSWHSYKRGVCSTKLNLKERKLKMPFMTLSICVPNVLDMVRTTPPPRLLSCLARNRTAPGDSDD